MPINLILFWMQIYRKYYTVLKVTSDTHLLFIHTLQEVINYLARQSLYKNTEWLPRPAGWNILMYVENCQVSGTGSLRSVPFCILYQWVYHELCVALCPPELVYWCLSVGVTVQSERIWDCASQRSTVTSGHKFTIVNSSQHILGWTHQTKPTLVWNSWIPFQSEEHVCVKGEGLGLTQACQYVKVKWLLNILQYI